MFVGTIFYLSSGLFLGWSLGANDAANVFGTAVASRMIRFKTAAAICSVFIILGAVVSGAGAAEGLGNLGAVNALGGAFTVALSAGVTVYWMTKLGLPVSITQAIVGAIVGWNFFSRSITDLDTLLKIVATWIACPILGGAFAAFIYRMTALVFDHANLHLLRWDFYTRWGLIVAGALGAYTLGANNIANVMGVFLTASPFTDFELGGLARVTSVHQLFFVGALAVAVGIFTYSKRVMITVGSSIMPLNPVGAWVVVVAQSLVLLLFASTALQDFLVQHGLPTVPLVPVSSSQAVVGAVVGIGMIKGARGARLIRWGVLARIASAWMATPVLSAVFCFVALFFVQNVFNEEVYEESRYVLSPPVVERLEALGVPTGELGRLQNRTFTAGLDFRDALRRLVRFSKAQEEIVLDSAEMYPLYIDPAKIEALPGELLSPGQTDALRELSGRTFGHKWELREALGELSGEWKTKENSRISRSYNRGLENRLERLYGLFHTRGG